MMCHLVSLLLLVFVTGPSEAGPPSLHSTDNMRILLLPFDTPVGTLVYRLRAYDPDYDYPLTFSVSDVEGANLVAATLVDIKSLPCRSGSYSCKGDVYLKRRLEKNRIYDFYITVTDQANQRFTGIARINATSGTYYVKDRMITVAEDKPVGFVVMEVLAQRMNPYTAVVFEVRGSDDFSVTTHLAKNNAGNGTIQIAKSLDFERQTVYQLEVLALYAYTNKRYDTRNVDALKLVIAVTDIQDTAPVFVSTPPLTRVSDNLPIGATVVKVKAEDGDKGEPRQIRYNLIQQGEKWGGFFSMEENSGKVILSRNLAQLSDIGIDIREPLILRVGAEELTTQAEQYPSMSTVVELGLIVDPAEDYPPVFSEDKYFGSIDENSPSGSTVQFRSLTSVEDKGKESPLLTLWRRGMNPFPVSPHARIRDKNEENEHLYSLTNFV